MENLESTKRLNVHCPVCDHLYEVTGLSRTNHYPHFKCTKCDSVFAFKYFFNETPQNYTCDIISLGQRPQKRCPRCQAMNLFENQSCIKCGVVFSNIESGNPYLVNLWSVLMSEFGNESLHNQFINESEKRNALSWAHDKYAHLISHLGDDETCKKMMKRIESILAYQTKKKSGSVSTKAIEDYARYATWILWTMCFVFIAVGLVQAQHRNLVGVGVSILIVYFFLQYKKSRN